MSDAESPPSEQPTGPSLPDVDDGIEDEEDEPEVVDMEPPRIKSRFGLYGLYKHHKKRKKLAKKGYVRWYLIDSTWPEPKYVRPTWTGDSIPVVEKDDKQYLFPKEAMLASEREGMWTVIHRDGEADPINLRDPMKNSVPADALDEYLSMSIATDPPSFWDKLDMDTEQILMYTIVGIIVIAFIGQLTGAF